MGLDSLQGLTFLDIGSGSGLFSLAARRRGATVYSFDYDPLSVECTKELMRRYFKENDDWTVEHGSVLDDEYMGNLGKFDIVYSWVFYIIREICIRHWKMLPPQLLMMGYCSFRSIITRYTGQHLTPGLNEHIIKHPGLESC